MAILIAILHNGIPLSNPLTIAASARDETDLDKLMARLVEVVDETMQPESVTLWLKPTQTRPDRSRASGPVRSESAVGDHAEGEQA